MCRREFLSVVGTVSLGATAGCMAAHLTPSYSSGLQARVALLSRESAPEDVPLTIDVSVPKETTTGESPARVRIASTNSGEGKLRVDYSTGRCAMFNRRNRHSDPRGVWLADPTANNWKRAGENDNGWKVDRTKNFGGYACLGALAPDESFGTDYFVVDSGNGGSYLPEGEYRWTRELHVDTAPPYDSFPSDREFEFGFSVAIEKP